MIDTTISKENLDRYYELEFDLESFKRKDPCGVVYQLMEHTDNQLDIELGGLFVAMISWGSRKVIYPTALNMMSNEMGWHPARFIMERRFVGSYSNTKNNCVYRTLNTHTFMQVCENVYKALSKHYHTAFTLEKYFEGKCTKDVIGELCEWLSPAKVGTMDKSACKRICMYVRWMTRRSTPDLGIWKNRPENDLYAVMDVHVCDLTKELLNNKRPSWKTCVELTNIFKEWDPDDPLKYDIALMTLSDRISLVEN